jgi:hypothetical protein
MDSNGELLIGGTSGPAVSTLTAGTGVTITNADGSITIAAPDVGDVTASSTTTFTNKTIDADGTGNSITNIEDANIKSAAAIDASKIADGSVSNAEFQRLDGVTSDIQTQLDGKQASGSYITASSTDTLTNKTLGAVTLSGAVTGGDQTISAAVLKDYAETDADLTSAVDLAIDLANGNTGSVTLAHNVDDLHFTNVPAAGFSTFTLIVTQDGTGSRTMDIDAVSVNGGGDVTAKTAGGAGLTLSTAAGSIDILTFLFKDAGTPFLFSQLAFA